MPTPTSLLVIEPHENLRDAYASVLRFAGYRVHEASCTVTAREHLVSRHPSVVLVNVHLPTSDEALSLVRRCRKEPALGDVTWVAMCENETGLNCEERAAFDAVLTTPLSYSDLVSAAGALCRPAALAAQDRAWDLCLS